MTATAIIPSGQAWWSSCVHTFGADQHDLLARAGAVFSRIGQALRGRDGVHEALRGRTGRSAILDALYHLDVVLTSGVGALDALARVAHYVFGITMDPTRVGWQRDEWRRALATIAPSVAAVIEPSTPLGAALRILTRTRNSIHSIPLDEYLHVAAAGHASRAEHRVMISAELGRQLRAASAPLGPPDQQGIFLDGGGVPFVNVAMFTERLLALTIETIGELLRSMLSCGQFVEGPVPGFSQRERQRAYCVSLAQVGAYPYLAGARGLPAAPSTHRAVMASVHRNRRPSAS